jgi:predicted nuclease of restriction endonuclease-like (RecB) superfamily
LQQFLLELGNGFSFVARQYRIQIDNDDFYIDLLFYNRKLKRLVAIDLKIDNFKAEYKGQMELYLRWLAKYEQEADENPPLGIILCAGKKQEQIELLELGSGFSFVARQYRIQVDDDDYYIDLLFYTRKLKRLVAIDLKVGRFKAEYKGQMELYLRWLAKYEQEADENPPLGIILCAGKKQEQIELLELDGSGFHVAEYLTALPPKAVLEQRLHQAMINARLRLDNKNE